ncbi:MAG TPA: hypothetical protein DCG48_06440 [Rhodospirillaceae bacterium]|nr:hypothetical protein [Rhodospirillaceae bacterium]
MTHPPHPVGERFAVYFLPPADSPLWRAGCRWLGRDADRPGGNVRAPTADLGSISETEWAAATAEPRRYGFHATLKPPFRLVDGCDLADLDGALARFAAERRAFSVAELRLKVLDGFLALCPVAPSSDLNALAADCVRDFEAFRHPPDPADLDRRRLRGLTPRQEANLTAWGYPYVLDEFRFHMTLTGRLAGDAAVRFLDVLAPMFAEALSGPLFVGGVALSREQSPGAPFETLRRYVFA